MSAQAIGGSGTQAWIRAPRLWLALAALLLAFCFLGSRGLYDPDEGRYTNVALNMVDSGNWIDPQRNDDTGHWTKPPLTYWAIAGSVAVFGENTWAARLPMALAFLGCIALCAGSARRLAPGRETLAALAYMTMLMPFGASAIVTTDFLLAFFQALAMFGFVRARFDEEAPGRWPWLMWTSFALAFLTKGPPALLPLIVIALVSWLAPSPLPRRWSLAQRLGGPLLFLAIALPWFVVVTMNHPGLLGYFLGAEVVARVASNDFARHGEWYGWAEIYIPTLLLGTLPWTLRVLRWLRGLPAAFRRWRDEANRQAEVEALLLVLWVLVPLAVFCIARSRLPLYLLPLFVPMALVVAQASPSGERGLPDWRLLVLWVCLLVGGRAAASYLLHSDQDASVWAHEISTRAPVPVREVVFVEDLPRYGLHLYLNVEVETLSLDELDNQPKFNPEYDESLATELKESAGAPGVIYVTKKKTWAAVQQHVEHMGFRAAALGEPLHGRIIFIVEPKHQPGKIRISHAHDCAQPVGNPFWSCLMFRIVGLDPAPFESLFALPDAELQARGIRRRRADADFGYPCRVGLSDALVGEELLLLPWRHHDVDSPYQASGPIYVRRGAARASLALEEVPPCVCRRLMSLRAYDDRALMVGADVVEGADVGARLSRLFEDERVSYVHLHNARPGCYSCAAVRA